MPETLLDVLAEILIEVTNYPEYRPKLFETEWKDFLIKEMRARNADASLDIFCSWFDYECQIEEEHVQQEEEEHHILKLIREQEDDADDLHARDCGDGSQSEEPPDSSDGGREEGDPG